MRIRSPKIGTDRRGVAAVEFAFLMPLLLGLIIGVWEMGRVIQVQQYLNGAARNGARLAAQGQIINLTGTPTYVYTSTGTPNVVSTVQQYLSAVGITNQTGLVVTCQFLNSDMSVDTNITDPYQMAKNQSFIVKVSIPYTSVQWTSLTLFNPGNITAQCLWQSMADVPFTVNTTVPGWTPTSN